MLVEKVKQEVQSSAACILEKNQLYQKAATGLADIKDLETYLLSARFIILNTPSHLQLASDAAGNAGHIDLQRFYSEKKEEEFGHHLWAEDDLNHLSINSTRYTELTKETHALVDWLASTAQNRPTRYFGYVILSEYLTVACGPVLVENFIEKCKLPETALSILTKHIEADTEHDEENFAELAQLFRAGDCTEIVTGVREGFAKLNALLDATIKTKTGEDHGSRIQGTREATTKLRVERN